MYYIGSVVEMLTRFDQLAALFDQNVPVHVQQHLLQCSWAQ